MSIKLNFMYKVLLKLRKIQFFWYNDFTNDEFEYYYNPNNEEIFMPNIEDYDNLNEGMNYKED